MSRKDYEKLARWVARERDENRRAKMACDLADLIAEDNPKFDRGIWHSRILEVAALRTHRPHLRDVPGGSFRRLPL